MKRTILSIALTVCLLFNLPTTALANTPVSGNDSATTTVSYHIDSQFMVYIPETLDLTSIDITNPYYFSAGTMELEDNHTVQVLLSNDLIELTNSKGQQITGHFYRTDNDREIQTNDCVAEFSNGITTCEYGIYFNPIIGTLHAGTYTGTTTFQVMLQ